MGRPKISLEEYKRRIKERFPNEDFEVLLYTSLGQPAKLRCKNCEKIIEVSKATNFIIHTKHYGCSECQSLLVKKRKEDLEKVQERYNIIEKYQATEKEHFRYKAQCKRCGHIRDTFLNNLMKNLECGCITGTYRRTPEEFERELVEKKNDEYELINNYEGMTKPILLRHKICGFIWKVRPSDILYERSANCPRCKKADSQGSKIVETFLQKNNLEYTREYVLEPTKLRLDFYLEYRGKRIGIEYNGSQHYKFSSFFYSSENDFLVQQERDRRKIQYCQENNIILLVIPYTLYEREINEKLFSFFHEVQRLKQEKPPKKIPYPTGR